MAHSEARAWWADVQHLRDDYERTDEARRRADQHDLASRRATREHNQAAIDGGHARTARRGDSDAGVGDARRAPDSPPALRRGEHEDPAAPARLTGAARTRGAGTPNRPTIEVRGRTTPAPMLPPAPEDRRRPPRRAVERVGARPDRVAMWALLMGLALILVAIGTADTPAFVALTLR